MWVEAKIFEKQFETLSQIDEFEINIKGLDKKFTTKKRYLYPMIDEKEAAATLRLEVENSDNSLYPGMYATVLSKSVENSYLVIPATAVIRKNNAFYAFIVGEYEGEYEPSVIDVTRLDSNTYIVNSGLEEGDEVVNNALFMIDSDAQINGMY